MEEGLGRAEVVPLLCRKLVAEDKQGERLFAQEWCFDPRNERDESGGRGS